MIDPAPLAIAQKSVVRQQSKRLKKNKMKRGNSDVPRFQCKVTVLFHLKLKIFF